MKTCFSLYTCIHRVRGDYLVFDQVMRPWNVDTMVMTFCSVNVFGMVPKKLLLFPLWECNSDSDLFFPPMLFSPLQMRSPKLTPNFTCVCVKAFPAGMRTTVKASSAFLHWASTMASTSTRKAASRCMSKGRWPVRPRHHLAKPWSAAKGTGVIGTSRPNCPLKVPMHFSFSWSGVSLVVSWSVWLKDLCSYEALFLLIEPRQWAT